MSMRKRLDRLVPVGLSGRTELGWLCAGLVLAALLSLGFLANFGRAVNALYIHNGSTRVLDSSAVMAPFSELVRGCFTPFGVLALLMLPLAGLHYSRHYSGGSRSIYTMRRLPSRWELHRRCLTLPVLTVLACGVITFALIGLYYIIYITKTPEACLTPGQWELFWRGIF